MAVDTIVGITDIVESMHLTISSLGGILSKPGQTRTKGVTGIVYQSIRTLTTTAGKALDLPLSQLNTMVEESDSSHGREAILSAVNGVLGDYLVATNNPLAITARFRRDGKLLEAQELSQLLQQANNRIVIMVHGSCMNDLQWHRDGHDHGTALSRDLGITPIYLHYNTGLHISENGRILADLLESLLTASPEPTELFIIAHSMGGLVSRSACHYAQQADHAWLKSLRKLIFLGTPHHGALLEKGGNWIDTTLEISPYSAPFARLGKIRSNGVTDLRYGNVLDEDWQGKDRFKMGKDPRTPVLLPQGVDCYAIAGTIAKEASKLGDDLIGDGLVTINSALGRHKNRQLQLNFPENHQWIGRDINHVDLLNHPTVYETIRQWMAS